MLGNTDKPIERIEDDILYINKYIIGLSKFIKTCDTPMTVAIQGDWGSGKTSFMNMIKNETSAELATVWINTWQFSQFNFGDSLTHLFLTALTESLGNETELKQSLKKLGQIAYTVGLKSVSQVSGIDLESAFKGTEEPENIIKTVVELKKRFQKCIDETLEKDKRSKFVIFIDDLDRLAPSKAVEILEVLKLFLDCEHCVFVLAIDYKVVSQGIRQKYGDGIEEDKGKNFFDKIIQVPFKIPIAHYSIASYIEHNLKRLGCVTECLSIYEKLISYSIGFNPRGIKRVFNAFSLLKEIYTDVDLSSRYMQSLLFAALCLQLSYEDIYNYIIRNKNEDVDVDVSFFNQFALSDSEENERAAEIIEEIGLANQKETVLSFMSAFCDALSGDGNNGIEDSSLYALDKILNIAGTMSKSDVNPVSSNGKAGKGMRYYNVHDNQYSWHSINEQIEKNKPGWNGSKIDSYELFGTQHRVSTLSEAVVNILSELYKKNKTRFEEIRINANQYNLYALFYGSKQKEGLVSPQDVLAAQVQIEGKNSYDQKIQFLRNLLAAMNYSDANLKLHVKLAHREQVNDRGETNQ